MSLANSRMCKGCGKQILFKHDPEDRTKLKAYEHDGSLHKCPRYEELQRLSGDRGIIDGAKTLVALSNHVLKRHRLELRIIELDGGST